jgi:hypothetical protein
LRTMYGSFGGVLSLALFKQSRQFGALSESDPILGSYFEKLSRRKRKGAPKDA